MTSFSQGKSGALGWTNLIYRFSVDPDPLSDGHEVGGGIEASLQSTVS